MCPSTRKRSNPHLADVKGNPKVLERWEGGGMTHLHILTEVDSPHSHLRWTRISGGGGGGGGGVWGVFLTILIR